MDSLLNKIEHVKMLKSGKDIQYFLNEAYRILENPIIMFDTGYNLLSYSENVVTDDPMWNDIIKNNSFSNEAQEIFKEEGFIDAVANAKITAFLLSDRLKYDRILGKIFDRKGTHVANLVMTACNRQFETEDIVIFEVVCKLISDEISSNEFYQNYGKIYNETLIKKLLDGSINDRKLYSAHIAILYNGLKENLYIAVIDTAHHDLECTRLMSLKDLLIRKQPAFKYSVYSNYIVFILSSNNITFNIKQDLDKLTRQLKKNNMYAGISSCFENLFELQKYYGEAVNALKKGLSNNNNQRIFLYDEIG